MAASKNLDMLHEKAAYNIKQETLFETGVLKEDRTKDIRIVGQVFSTYWILQYEDSMYMVDQHAAHEKVLYERFMKQIAEHKPMVQMVNPPIVLSLSMLEQQMVDDNIEVFDELGYKIESFGGREYIVTADVRRCRFMLPSPEILIRDMGILQEMLFLHASHL